MDGGVIGSRKRRAPRCLAYTDWSPVRAGWQRIADHEVKKQSLAFPTKFLQAAIGIIAMGALALLLWEPHVEGRNAHASLFEIYFKDPFLAFAYVASIPFFAGLYQAFKVLGYIGQEKAFSLVTI